MKVIVQPDPLLYKLCGRQKIAPGTPLRRSRFCMALPCEDGTLLYQFQTGELRLLSPEETDEQHARELAEAWYYVPRDWDEIEYMRQLHKILALSYVFKKEKTTFTILPTTDCNARCAYCFERDVRPVSMTPETADTVADYISRVCGGQPVSIHWFGGEPLYNRDAIDRISAGLRAHGVEYHAKMTSNGYFLDRETAQTARRDWHLDNVQITLDGTEKIYNRTKAYRHCEGSAFERVLNNVDGALDAGIQVFLRLNMEAKNADDLFLLADELGARFSKRDNLFVHVVLLYEMAGKISTFSGEADAVERCMSLIAKLDSYGLHSEITPLPGKQFANHCMADNDSCEVICPDGTIVKCEHVNIAEPVGTIFEDRRDEEAIRSWKERAELPECRNCPLFPRCGMLKKCEWIKNGCPESRRTLLQKRLERQILAAYRTYKAKTEESL